MGCNKTLYGGFEFSLTHISPAKNAYYGIEFHGLLVSKQGIYLLFLTSQGTEQKGQLHAPRERTTPARAQGKTLQRIEPLATGVRLKNFVYIFLFSPKE